MVKPRAPEAMTLSSSHSYFSLHGCSLSSMRVLFLGLIILVNNSSNYNASVHAAFVVNTRSSSSISGSMKPSVTAASLAPRSPTTISRRCIASTNAVGPLRTLSYRLHHHHHEGRHQHPNPFRTRNCSRFSRKYGCASIQTPIPTATRYVQ